MFVIVQNSSGLIGENCVAGNFGLFVGTMNKIAVDMNRANTAPSSFVIDRRIDYANKKCHSG